MIALWFVVGLIVGLVGWGVALVAWLLTSSVDAAVVAFAIALTVSGFVYMPWIAATLTNIYRLRVGTTTTEATRRSPERAAHRADDRGPVSLRRRPRG